MFVTLFLTESGSSSAVLLPSGQQLQSEQYCPPEQGVALFSAHKWINIICWGILVDVGILLARYGKGLEQWLNLHAVTMALVALPSLIINITFIFDTATPQEQNPQLAGAHDIVGFIFVGATVLQMLSGIFLRLGVESNIVVFNLKLRQLSHLVLGHSIYLLGKAQIGLGFYTVYTKQCNPAQFTFFWTLYAFIFFWRIVLESLYHSGFLHKLKFKKSEASVTLKSDSIEAFIKTGDMAAIENDYSNLLWVTFNEKIINLTGLTHPGGNFIWEAVKGREVSRFIYGAYGLEKHDMAPYRHSMAAFKVMEARVIGSLPMLPIYLLDNEQSTMATDFNDHWRLNKVNVMNTHVSRFHFVHSKAKIKKSLTNINSFGRYCTLRSKDPKIAIRPYTLVLSMDDSQIQERKWLYEYLHARLEGKGFELPNSVGSLEGLSFLIKKYQSPTGFSQYIHTHDQEEYFIEGPFGVSFGLPSEGRFAMICGGTGYFPVLDLLDYYYRKSIYQILKERGNQKWADESNEYSNFEFKDRLEFILFLAIADESDLVDKDEFLRLVEFQSLLQKPICRIIVKIRKPIQGMECVTDRFDATFFQKYMNVPEYQRFLICGPPQMNKDVPNILLGLGAQASQIHLI